MLNIYDLNVLEIKEQLKKHYIAPFRATQIWNFLYIWDAKNFDQMKTIPKKEQEKLKEIFEIGVLNEKKLQKSEDETQKALLTLQDGENVETVLMKYKHGYSVCVSSQIGCKVGCSFCASHLLGFKRNLTCGEMVAQVMYWNEKLRKIDKRVNNVVIMGIGEPFYNLDNVLKFIDTINDDKGLNIAARKITISTSGITPKFEQFINYEKQINLAVSLHAPTDEIRTQIMKINKAYNIKDLMDKIDQYLNSTNRQVTFEYILLNGINDSELEAKNLANLIGKRNIHVNLIPYNTVFETEYKKSNLQKIDKFLEILNQKNISATKRQQKGADIDGACGQLRSKDELESSK